MRGVSTEDAESIIAIERACSALSLMGCVFVLLTFSISEAFRQRAINRMVFYATFGNMLTNVATLMTTSYTHSVDSFGCQLQAFLIQVFMQGDAYWALAMAINVYLTFYHKYDARMLRKMEIPYLFLCYGVPFIPGFTFLFVSNQQDGRPYGDAVLWCWLKSEWEVYRVATFYGPIWVAIIIATAIYIRAGREIYRKRQKMLNFSSTGTGTAIGTETFSPIHEFSPAFNFKTTEVTQTTEFIQAPAPVAKPGTTPPGPNASYSVTVSTDAQAANHLNMRVSLEDPDNSDASTDTTALNTATSNTNNNNSNNNNNNNQPQPAPTTTTAVASVGRGSKRSRVMSTTQISIAPTVTATITTAANANANAQSRRRNYYESHNATWSYTKCAILFFSVLLITWLPSSGNRVYSMINTGDVSRPLFFASAFVLPLQGFWNAIIYIVTSWAACKSLWGYCAGVVAGWRDWVSVREENNLILPFLRSVVDFSKLCALAESQQLKPAVDMLERLIKTEPGLWNKSTKTDVVRQVIRELKDGEYVLFHIRAQNAGLLLSGRQHNILFEAFELLASNEDVMSCKGSLVREFPDCAAAMDRAKVFDSHFLDEFVNVLCSLELTPPSQEDSGYDTTSPSFVTDMVMGAIAGVGRVVNQPHRISKRSREHVAWRKAEEGPFYRSPTWLLLRVGLRLVLDRQLPSGAGRVLYKAVITFHHACLLDQAVNHEQSSDLRFAMTAKLVRRIRKLDPQENPPWLRKIRKIISMNLNDLRGRWKEVQEADAAKNAPGSHVEQLQFEPDCKLRLPKWKNHLSSITSRNLPGQDGSGAGDTTTFAKFQATDLPSLSISESLHGPEKECSVLLEFEAWVESNLSTWVHRWLQNHADDPAHARTRADLGTLQELTQEYHNRASRLYKGDPEALSLMCLNIVELWVVMDKIAGKAIPLLLQYDPGFGPQPKLFHRLLLPTKQQMTRLDNLEQYLSTRGGARHAESFAVRYFDSSPECQSCLDRIITASERLQAKKRQEYDAHQRKHDELLREQRNVCIDGLNVDCKAIVFEVNVPKLVAIWRDTTTHLFLHVFGDPETPQKASSLCYAVEHPGLAPHSSTSTSLVQLASPAPLHGSHSGPKHIRDIIDANDVVIRDSGMHYKECSYAEHQRVPRLGEWTRSTQHTSNQVISSQFECPLAMPLDEARAFGHLRSGLRLQWGNILCQLAIPSLNLNRKSTYLLVLQAVHEAGPPVPSRNVTSIFREAHLDTPRAMFGNHMADALSETLDRFSGNWQNNVAQGHLRTVLHTPAHLSSFTEASVLIHDHISTTAGPSEAIELLLAHRWRKVMHKAMGYVKQEVVEHANTGFHEAIQRFWKDNDMGQDRSWSAREGLQGHVLESSIPREGDGEPITITFNLLEGRLLVNGDPVSRLPKKYEAHESYVQLFGKRVLQVGPSTLEGMRFATCRDHHGWVFHFAMIGPNLVIQAVASGQGSEDGAICEFVPSSQLEGDLPSSFLKNHSHWFNLATDTIEFRPLDKPWETSSANWIMAPIESKEHLDMIFHQVDSTVVLHLPRFCLSFTLTEGQSRIRSKDYAGMCIDAESQSLGTLAGLRPRLVLKQDQSVSERRRPRRMVLIPRVPLCVKQATDHVSVTRVRPPNTHIKHDAFTVDPRLGRLTSSGAISSTLHLCRLHAITSHCLPDPLTGRTGTEEALRILRSASVRSFQHLDPESSDVLHLIARISPRRTAYPKGTTDMERSEWANSLPMLSQHDGFRPAVESVLEHARVCKLLREADSPPPLKMASLLPSLGTFVERAQIRNATFCVSEFATEPNRYKIAFFLSTLNWDIAQTLMAIANVRTKFGALGPDAITPPTGTVRFNLGYTRPGLSYVVEKIIRANSWSFDDSPESKLPQLDRESRDRAQRRRRRAWTNRVDEVTDNFMAQLEAQWAEGGWTVETPQDLNFNTHLDVDTIMSEVRTALEVTRATGLFDDYLDRLVEELGDMTLVPREEEEPDQNIPEAHPGPAQQQQQQPSRPPLGFVGSRALFSSRAAPSTARPQPADFTANYKHTTQTPGDDRLLVRLFDRLSHLCGERTYQESYVKELRRHSGSIAVPRYQLGLDSVSLKQRLKENLILCQRQSKEIRRAIQQALGGQSIADQVCQAAGMYPRLTTIFLLERLARGFWEDMGKEWRRMERIVNASRRLDRPSDFLEEVQNSGSHECEEGDPLKHPESLLLEWRIAAQMRDPPHAKNSVMQLNMGEGKSSVIVPAVAAALADGTRLVRVVVAKPQSKQMMQTLIRTLGGLLNRRIFYLPLSRAVRLNEAGRKGVQQILESCKKEGGVLLVQPEHILSFKLMGLEHTWMGSAAGPPGDELLAAYQDLERVSRDIVDESDESFSVKFELSYSMGSQRPIDMSPDRWTLIQDIMDIVLDVAEKLAGEGLLVENHGNKCRFPTIRVLEEDAGKRLVLGVAKQICRRGLRGFPLQHQSKQNRQVVRRYILSPSLDSEQIARVENVPNGFFSQQTTKNTLFLLRGLLANGVILFALRQQRFRVNYGLAPDRRPPTMLAVPYRAKDSPAPRSEFSHPDAVIILTCLSYYYKGLSDDELPAAAAAWTQLPPSARHFSGVNLKDNILCEQTIFPALRFTKPAVDFYLANVVFPKEMRESPSKLSASGWDLAKDKAHPLTGFSGTTDSKCLLPLSVTALDLPEQRETNSAVLACILRPENTVLELGGDQSPPSTSTLTVDLLLSAATEPSQPMRVILDVGAQIIELGNFQVASRWLAKVPVEDADAVIFVDDQDELSVLTRNGMVESFLTSPFATQTDRCLVFLDQAHTRGTDLKLPDSYRAAVTLGPGVTKDTLVQACMRMRKLGNGQSVTFCVSPEMQKRIRHLAKVDGMNRPITVTDVLVCAIVETWDDTHRGVPLWVIQGIRHQHQEEVWKRLDDTRELSREDVESYMEDEARTLEQRYRPVLTSRLNKARELEHRRDQVDQIRSKCAEFDLGRELAPEIEEEHQHTLHPHVREFVVSGDIPNNSPAFIPAFQSLSSLCSAEPPNFPTNDLLVTADFATTVEPEAEPLNPNNNNLDAHHHHYQRPVQWILTHLTTPTPNHRHGMCMVIISPFEANELAPLIRKGGGGGGVAVQLRAYLPRTSLSFRSLEDLTWYSIHHHSPPAGGPALPAVPPALVVQLNLFAGQLYLRSYGAYVDLCRFLGLAYTENEGEADVPADGFVGAQAAGGGRRGGYEECEFEASPVAFLGVLFKTVRRDCLGIGKTHMGRILAGEILTERDFGGADDDGGGAEEDVVMGVVDDFDDSDGGSSGRRQEEEPDDSFMDVEY
ncbi:hypothetical protein C8A00DRAFT_41452 [Chaetomidium leptoderma]|uniref:ubiquitinyl hydrolase 1 n=1 Tax=Chaetomidium leptoderma TaxID=669021 RepID=A0AAN6VRC1_9PEZI|nr:hypothetical protein C8A00DRAFT_41452 [Chaetomidium leptoderma]